ncbi:MAG: thioredoxin [Microthrixaceae bacterium]|nr:thioredoxin [Microthrixaceae bacterium]
MPGLRHEEPRSFRDAWTGAVRELPPPASWVVDADASDFDEVVGTSKLPVVVDLWAPWCGPCRTVSPLLEQLAEEYAGRMKLVKVNVDEAPAVQARFGVQGIPTFVLLSGGEEIARLVGAHPLASLRSWFDNAVAA